MDNKKKFRKIGVLTSGGDASGMNPAVRAIARAAVAFGVTPVAVNMGYQGLIDGNISPLELRDVANIINVGGTKLYSDRCDKFKTHEGLTQAVETCKKHGIDGIIAIGGDGTFKGARDLTAYGIPCIGIPATIDNDITSTSYTIGFDTCLNTIVEMVDRIRDTCESHVRCNVVEVMGRGSGELALHSGLAVGATAIIIKEIFYDEDAIVKKILQGKSLGKRSFIIVVSENMGSDFAEKFYKRIEEKTGIPTRFARLAHVQRGGVPTCRDRNIASKMGYKAVELLCEGKSNLVICYEAGMVYGMEINFALKLDRLYKGKLTSEEIKAIPEQEMKKMMMIIKHKKDEMQHIYCINDAISI